MVKKRKPDDDGPDILTIKNPPPPPGFGRNRRNPSCRPGRGWLKTPHPAGD